MNLKLKITLIFCFLAIYTNTKAQDTSRIAIIQDQVWQYFNKAETSQNDSLKIAYNDEAAITLSTALYLDAAFDYKFWKLPNIMATKSSDGIVRTLTWCLMLSDGTYKYWGFVMTNKNKELVVTQLFDKSSQTQSPEKNNMQAPNWYGAIYYEIIQVAGKKGNVYGVAGWNGGDMFVNRKVLEQIVVEQNGEPIFGGDFQNETSSGLQRLVFEFSQKAAMTLRWDNKLLMFVGDHLSPSSFQFKGEKRFYGPDMSFDGFGFENGKWFYEPDLDVKNKN